MQTMSQEQMGSVLKHFPGYGNNSDTHTGVAYDERPYETFDNSDFLPFRQESMPEPIWYWYPTMWFPAWMIRSPGLHISVGT